MAGDLGLDVLSEQMVMENVPQFPVTGPYHGHDDVRAWWRDQASRPARAGNGERLEARPVPGRGREGY